MGTHYTARFCAALLLALTAISAQAAEQRAPFFGVVSHFLHNKYIYKEKDDSWLTTRTSPALSDLGTEWVTEQIYALTSKSRALVDDGTSSDVERAKIEDRRRLVDQWLAVHDQKKRKVVLTILAAAPKARNFEQINHDFAQWIAQLVHRHPSIVAVQLHNEPNLRSFWPGSPQDYVDTYRPIALEIKRVNPNVDITVGAISSLSWDKGREWFRSAMHSGLLDFADGVSVHPYNLKAPPEQDPHLSIAATSPNTQLGQAIASFWGEVQSYNQAHKPLKLYFTELGYSSAPNGIAGIGDEVLQAKYLTRLMAIYLDARARQKIPLEAVFWYDLKSDGDKAANQEDNFGLVSADLKRKKPAFFAYKNLISAIGDVSDLNAVDVTSQKADTDTILMGWQRSSRRQIIVPFWTTGQSEGEASVKLPAGFDQSSVKATVIDLMSGQRAAVPIASGIVNVKSKDYVQVLLIQ